MTGSARGSRWTQRVAGFIRLVEMVWLCVWGMGLSVPVVAEELKVGYVDVARLFDSYERTKQSESLLQQKSQQFERELQQRIEELKKLRAGLELLSERERDVRQREIDQKADDLKRFDLYTKRDLVKERDRITQDIIEEIQQTVQAYAKANGFSLVLDERSVLYGQAVYDITEEVVKQLNARKGTR
jgi:outer membrane protein